MCTMINGKEPSTFNTHIQDHCMCVGFFVAHTLTKLTEIYLKIDVSLNRAFEIPIWSGTSSRGRIGCTHCVVG